MITIKIYKYDSSQEANGYRGEDFSSYLLQGSENKEDITQELDTCEIALMGLPFEQEFDPQTKFIMDYYQEEINEIPDFTKHWVVQKDMVEKPILSDDNYFDHHISLIEPSVIAQQRLVDNIAVTYKLKDVSLEETPIFDINAVAPISFQEGVTIPEKNFGLVWLGSGGIFGSMGYYTFGKYFKLEGSFKILDENNNEYETLYNEISNFTNGARFKIPKLAIYGGVNGSKNFDFIGYASIDYLIEEFPMNDENNITPICSGSFIENNPLLKNAYYVPKEMPDFVLKDGNENLLNEWITENVFEETGIGSYNYGCYFKKYTDTTQQVGPSYISPNIPVRKDYAYKISLQLHSFSDDIGQITNNSHARTYRGSNPTSLATATSFRDTTGYVNVAKPETVSSLSNLQSSASCNFNFYGLDARTILLTSATPYSALALLQKAIVNSGVYEKKANVYVADVNNCDYPFVIDSNYLDKLGATTIIENFYNQKNLWEVMIEVGHYIHAIPELKFGADDKFLITFNELGRTDQKENLGTKVSIFNSRGVEDYISSTSSYVANMVQLGGDITEWVAPKTSSDDLLVHNDTAEIKVAKPIIELLEVRVKKVADNNTGDISLGDTADMTKFIYEENVYSLLSIVHTVIPNRGISMYYKLGTDKIIGGDYQLPTENTGDKWNDYAFKKILWYAYFYETHQRFPNDTDIGIASPWETIKVNDFIFYVRYRTKDNVRESHTRPDLRKYLLNSKYDKFPEHNQFNNQTDVLVDSEKFGNNLFGKLIKTGNTSYEITEWHSNIAEVKKKGELYRINGELYYVAKVTNTWFCSQIISKVSYSKDYNELSAIIGIPSEPRFYEISEQSSILRDVAINDYFLLTDDQTKIETSDLSSYIKDYEVVGNLIFGSGTPFAKYALTVFKGDADANKYDQTVGQSNFYKEIFLPINAFSSGNTLTYEWDTVDNYSAGDKVIDATTPSSATDDAYKSLLGVGYTDTYGRATLFDFYIMQDDLLAEMTPEQIVALPESPINTKYCYVGEVNNGDPHVPNAFYDGFVFQEKNRQPKPGDVIYRNDNNGDPFIIAICYGYYQNISFWNEYNYGLAQFFPKDTRNGVSDFTLFASNNPNFSYIPTLHDNHYEFGNFNSVGLSLLKDCRETISINYNLQAITTSDTFVLSPFLFEPNKPNLQMVLLNEEINKLTDGYINDGVIIKNVYDINNNLRADWRFTLDTQDMDEYFRIFMPHVVAVSNEHFEASAKERVKAIAICEMPKDSNNNFVSQSKYKLVVGRNIPTDWTKSQALATWYIGSPVKRNVFTKKQ